MKRPLDHFPEGESAWRRGIAGFFTRLRGLAPPIVLAILTMSAPWWWPSDIGPHLELDTTWTIVCAAGAVGLVCVAGLLYARTRAIRSLRIKALLHNFSHHLRDHQTRVFRHTSPRDPCDTEGHALERLCQYSDSTCEYIKDYFILLARDPSIDCAMRVAVEVNGQDGSKRVVYRSLGRSSGLSADRARTSEDIPANEGIPRFFIEEKSCKGILRYNDIKEAAAVGAFRLTRNEELYPQEIVTLLVAPMNAWCGMRQDMLGILFVTSRKKGVFQRKHVDCMRFIADTVASSLSFAVQRLMESGAITTVRRSQ